MIETADSTNDAAEGDAWYCIRSKVKHEHIAAGKLRELGLDVFNPSLRIRKSTRRGPVWMTEPLFPCYIFARFSLKARLDAVRYATGVVTVVHFGDKFPAVPDETLAELRSVFKEREVVEQPSLVKPGESVRISGGAFHGLTAVVKHVMPSAQRVQVLLEMLGRVSIIEVDVQQAIPADSTRRKQMMVEADQED